MIAAAPTAVAPEESGFYARMSAKVVHRCTLMIFYGILRNFSWQGRIGHPAFFPGYDAGRSIVMESIKLALAK